MGATGDDGGELMTQPGNPTAADDSNIRGHELGSFLGKPIEEKPIWVGLYENVHDVFFPPKLPPLELTSQPMSVAPAWLRTVR